MNDRREHWERLWRNKAPEQVSWYQRDPAISLELIAAAGIAKDAGILDVGGGASLLVDRLLDLGHSNLAVLDVSAAALEACRARLGPRAAAVEWHLADVTGFEPRRNYALWHDRAVFHFLTGAEDRRRYVAVLRKALKPGGAVVIATFAPDGPSRCSGLEVMRYDEKSLGAEFGADFELREVRRETHKTPLDADQCFNYCRLTFKGDGPFEEGTDP
jgi:trans-aconitate methyltransferase